MTETDRTWDEAFIGRLERLVTEGDRGTLALLRRALGDEPPYAVYRWLPVNLPRWQEEPALTVGPLFALWHQGRDRPESLDGNLGQSLRRLRLQLERAGGSAEGIERRLLAMLNSRREDLDHHLHHTVALLRGHDIPVDWRRLLRDVLAWGHPDRYVQKNWARAFWAYREEDNPTDGAATESASS
jgi:CRISPR system Cascade subunit CasB